jgi:hypothetical protein
MVLKAWEYWWLILVAAGITFGIGAAIWMYAATALVRVVAPSRCWLEKKARLGTLGVWLMTISAGVAAIGIVIVVGHWAYVRANSPM